MNKFEILIRDNEVLSIQGLFKIGRNSLSTCLIEANRTLHAELTSDSSGPHTVTFVTISELQLLI